jgi:hypothetical protein
MRFAEQLPAPHCCIMRAVSYGSKVWVDMSCIWMHRRGLGSIFLSRTPRSDNTRWFVSWWGLQSSCQHHIVVLWGQFPMDRKFEWIWAVYECIEEGWGVFFCLEPPEVTIQGDLCPDEVCRAAASTTLLYYEGSSLWIESLSGYELYMNV